MNNITLTWTMTHNNPKPKQNIIQKVVGLGAEIDMLKSDSAERNARLDRLENQMAEATLDRARICARLTRVENQIAADREQYREKLQQQDLEIQRLRKLVEQQRQQ